jgi:Tetratricopeptide repeat
MASKLEEMTVISKSVGGVALLGLWFGLGAVYAGAQTAPSSDKPKLPTCVDTKGKTPCAKADDTTKGSPGDSSTPPSSAQQFPFPAEDSKHGGDVQQEGVPPAPAPAKTPPSQDNGASSSSKPATGNAAQDHPFPGESGTSDVPSPDAGTPSSSGGGFSSSRDNAPAEDDPAPTMEDPDAPIKASPLADLGSSGKTSERRAKLEATRFDDDLKVGDFYRSSGNFKGAYMRYKDAVEHDPEDPDAQFYLAEMALKLQKPDEAKAHYEACLKIDSGGEHAKEARTSLAQLEGKAQSK